MLCTTEESARCGLLLRRSRDRKQGFLSSSYDCLKACMKEKARWVQLCENHTPDDRSTGEEDVYSLIGGFYIFPRQRKLMLSS